MKQHAKTIFLPSGCFERYIDFSHYPEGAEWFKHGIALAGIGKHVPGYLIDYPKPRRQIVIVVTCGTYSVDTLDKVVTLSAGELFIIPAGIRQRYWTDSYSECLFFLLAPFTEDWPQSTGIHIRRVRPVGGARRLRRGLPQRAPRRGRESGKREDSSGGIDPVGGKILPVVKSGAEEIRRRHGYGNGTGQHQIERSHRPGSFLFDFGQCPLYL